MDSVQARSVREESARGRDAALDCLKVAAGAVEVAGWVKVRLFGIRDAYIRMAIFRFYEL